MKRIGCLLTILAMMLALWGSIPGAAFAGAEEEYTLPREEGTRQVVFYWYGEAWIMIPVICGSGIQMPTDTDTCSIPARMEPRWC